MADASSVLDRLRPLRAPPDDGASAILLMGLLGAVAAMLLAVSLRRLFARHRPLRRAALDALAASRVLPGPERLAAQARILRDVARAHDDDAAALQGAAWLARLDALFDTRLFSDGAGQAFGEALYRPCDDAPVETLDRELARLFARLAR